MAVKVTGWRGELVSLHYIEDDNSFVFYDSAGNDFSLTPEELSDLYEILCEIPDEY